MFFQKRLIKDNHKSCDELEPSGEYIHCMDFVKQTLKYEKTKEDKIVILDFLLGVIKKDLQYDILTTILYNEEGFSERITTIFPIYYYDEDGNKLETYTKKKTYKNIDLSEDCVLVMAWHRDRLRGTIKNIYKNNFKYHSSNHLAYYFTHIDVCYAHNGLHSITSGIGHQKGYIKAVECDISKLFNHVYTDGKTWYNSHNDEYLTDVYDFRIAILYEIARTKYNLLNLRAQGEKIMRYKNKFNLQLNQNIFLAKKTIVQNIYNSAKLEGVNVTFSETQTILDGVNVPNVTLDDLEVILNLRDGWKFLIKTINNPIDVEYICKVNSYISRNESLDPGVLRYGHVGISGTDYKPPIPDKETIESKLKEINSLSTATERALEYFVWAIKSQLFWDGNKRTSTLIANKILIEGGAGVLTVPEEKIQEFNTNLNSYYNNGCKESLKEYLYNNFISGMDIENKRGNLLEDD